MHMLVQLKKIIFIICVASCDLSCVILCNIMHISVTVNAQIHVRVAYQFLQPVRILAC